MRKVFLTVLAAIIALSLGVATAFAAGPGGGCHFIDSDGDGVCDNAAAGACTFADADGDGVCDVCGASHGSCPLGRGAAFVDADGDGICDNYASGQCRGGGCGRGVRSGHGSGFRGGRGR